MQVQTTGEKYPIAIRILHWLMALMILGLLAVGLIMSDMPRSDPDRGLLFALHKSFGLTVLALAFFRLAFKLSSKTPELPGTIPAIERHMASAGHWTLYAFMFLMPVSGYLMSASFGLPVTWFGLPVPRLVSIDRARGNLAGDIHSYAAYALMGLLALHIGAVLLHYLKHRVNLLRRMT